MGLWARHRALEARGCARRGRCGRSLPVLGGSRLRLLGLGAVHVL